ncbi:MAG: GumC family protein [Desulfobacca sp.]|uniref:GumC family protein n=1 Tax=Desulfobacca sp. TaxID=2067990 RepID=UPI00404A2B94
MQKNNRAPALPPKRAKKFDIFWFVQHRAATILVLGGALFALFLPFAVLKGNYAFETAGKLLIAREAPKIIGSKDEYNNLVNYFHDYAKTQVERIRSLDNLEAALKNVPPEVQTHFRPGNMDLSLAAVILQRSLEVSVIGGTHLIQVKLTGGKAVYLADMVNAIMDAYIQKLREESETRDSRRLAFLIQERDELKKQIEEQTKSLETIVQQTMSSDFADNANVFLQKYLSVQDAFLRADVARIAAQNTYEQTVAENAAVKNVPIKVLADEMVAGDQSLWRTTSWTYEKLQELRASIDGVTKANPDRQYIEQRMKGMEEYERKQREEIRKQSEKIVNEKRELELTKKTLAAQYDYLNKAKTANDLKEALDKAREQLEQSLDGMLQGRQLKQSIENSRKKYFDLENRIRDLMLEAKTPLLVSVESYAVPPTSPSSSNKKKLVMLSVALSFGLVTMVLFAIDFADNRIHSPQDITQYLGVPPSWPISNYMPAPGRAVSFAALTWQDPEHKIARALGSLAVRLDRERSRFGAKIVLCTGVHAGCGVTSIVLNTAQAMKKFCQRILVVDANRAHPNMLTLLDPPAGRETAGPNAPDAPRWELGIYHDDRRELDFFSLDRLDQFTADSGGLSQFLQEARQRYDFIFIDSEPILKSDFTEMLVVQADVVVLCLQGDHTLYQDFVRATEIILRLEVPALATVLNWGGPKPTAWSDDILGKLTDRQWLEAKCHKLWQAAQQAPPLLQQWLQKIRVRKHGS